MEIILLLGFLIKIGEIFIVFEFLWNLLIVIPLSGFIKSLNVAKIIKLIGCYFSTSLIALLTSLILSRGEMNIYTQIIFIILGAFSIYVVGANDVNEQHKTAMKNPELYYEIKKQTFFPIMLMFGMPLLYLVMLQYEFLADNSVNRFLFNSMIYADEIPLVGWFLSFFGGSFMLYIILVMLATIGLIVGKFSKKD
jgi:hypothetical protein